MGTWERGNMGAWKHGSVRMWECGNLVVWEHGSVGTWERGNMGVLVQGYRFFTAVCLLAKVGKNAQSSPMLEKRKTIRDNITQFTYTVTNYLYFMSGGS